MDPLTLFLSSQMLMLCLSIFAITYLVQLVAEFYKPSLKTKPVWTEIALHVIPLAIGTVLGIPNLFTYPTPMHVGGRMCFGLIAGLFSNMVYKLIKGAVQAKFPDAPGGQ